MTHLSLKNDQERTGKEGKGTLHKNKKGSSTEEKDYEEERRGVHEENKSHEKNKSRRPEPKLYMTIGRKATGPEGHRPVGRRPEDAVLTDLSKCFFIIYTLLVFNKSNTTP
jgi:hypothetical protein